jgi:hypothetical protein
MDLGSNNECGLSEQASFQLGELSPGNSPLDLDLRDAYPFPYDRFAPEIQVVTLP